MVKIADCASGKTHYLGLQVFCERDEAGVEITVVTAHHVCVEAVEAFGERLCLAAVNF